MSRRQDARVRLHAELMPGGDRGEHDYRLAIYRRWCTANGQLAEPPAGPWPADYPGPTQVILRFLHAEYLSGKQPRWASNTVNSLVLGVVNELKWLGHGDELDEELLRRYRRRVRDELGARRLQQTDALTKEQVIAAPGRVQEQVHPLSADAVRLRGIIAVADALGVDPTDPSYVIQRLRREAFERRGDSIVIAADSGRPTCQYPGCERPVSAATGSTPRRYCGQWDERTGRAHDWQNVRWARRQSVQAPGKVKKAMRPPRQVLDAERQPEMFATLIAALESAGDAEFPLARPVAEGDEHPELEQLKKDRESLFYAWTRPFPTTAPRAANSKRPPSAELRAQIAASTPEERVWWLAQMDEWLWLRRRDAAYLLCGVLTARRHVELERLTVGDMTPVDSGYEYVVRDHKGNRIAVIRGGKPVPLTRSIGHLSTCAAHCPACAMRDHLEVRERGGASEDAPLFVGLDGTALGTAGGSDVVKRMAAVVEDLDDNPDGTPRSYSSRTLRVTGATVARREGMSHREIADEVTGHRSEDMVAQYVRRNDAFSVELVLSLVGSERPPVGSRSGARQVSHTAVTEEKTGDEA